MARVLVMRSPARFRRYSARASALAAALIAAIVVPSAPVAQALPAGGNLCSLGPRSTVTTGADLVIGTGGDDADLQGGSGDDTILGCGGNDVIDGGSGNDLLIGGLGDDSVTGGSGDDMFDSGEYRTWDTTFTPGLPLGQGTANMREIVFTVDPMEIRTINVRLDISHTSPSDLKIKLLTPVLSTTTGEPRTVVLTDQRCFGPSATTNMCGPGQFHSATSPEVGVTFTSDTSTSIQQSKARNRNLNGIHHPRGTLDGGFRFKPSCTAGDCTYTLQFTDAVNNGITGRINYAAIDIEGPSPVDGRDLYVGGDGTNDLATYASRTGDISYNGEDNKANDGEAGERDKVRNDIEWFYGGFGNDTLVGTNNTHGGWNDLRGMEGNDTTYGLDGNDRLDYHASWGVDAMYGGPGNDHLDGGSRPPALDHEDGGTGFDLCENALTWVDCEQFEDP